MIKNYLIVFAVIALCASLPLGLYELFGRAGLIAYAILSGGMTMVVFCACAMGSRRKPNPTYPQTILK